jgi:alpha-tubulin suppressor-like RCC1 family protein
MKQLGHGDNTYINLFTFVRDPWDILDTCAEVACGGDFIVVVMDSGLVYSCGNNSNNQLGHRCLVVPPKATSSCFRSSKIVNDVNSLLSSDIGKLVPVDFGKPLNVVNVSCGESHVIYLSKQVHVISVSFLLLKID